MCLSVGSLLQNVYILQIACQTVEVETESDDEFRRNGEPDIIGLHVALQALRFEKQRGDFHLRRVLGRNCLHEPLYGLAGVYDILHQNYRTTGNFSRKAHHLLHRPGRRGPLVAFKADKRYFGISVDVQKKLGGKRKRAVEHAHQQRTASLEFGRNLLCQFLDTLLDLLTFNVGLESEPVVCHLFHRAKIVTQNYTMFSIYRQSPPNYFLFFAIPAIPATNPARKMLPSTYR